MRKVTERENKTSADYKVKITLEEILKLKAIEKAKARVDAETEEREEERCNLERIGKKMSEPYEYKDYIERSKEFKLIIRKFAVELGVSVKDLDVMELFQSIKDTGAMFTMREHPGEVCGLGIGNVGQFNNVGIRLNGESYNLGKYFKSFPIDTKVKDDRYGEILKLKEREYVQPVLSNSQEQLIEIIEDVVGDRGLAYESYHKIYLCHDVQCKEVIDLSNPLTVIFQYIQACYETGDIK